SSVDSAREAYQISFVRYKENVGTFLELDDATTNYLSALASLSSAYCAYERAQINLLYSMGILVEEVDKYADFRQNK
ncbi:MAG: TolC family protein, partial [bacterium]|nr:TolC family protein [bacterium]